MLIEQQIKLYRALNEWFKSPLGLAVAEEFTTVLDPIKEFIRGETLLQLGHCGDNRWLEQLDFKHKWIASPFPCGNQTQLEAALHQLPLARNSIDCVVIPLTSEPFGASYSLIDEIDRVLNPTGYIIFLNLNPWSIWGAAMKSGLLHCYNYHKVKMRTPFNLNRTLLQRGYRQCALSNFCYIPPINQQTIIKKLTFLDEVGRMVWPFPSGFYCYIAQKYQIIDPSITTVPVEQPVPKEYKSPLQPALNKDLLL